MDFVTTYKLGTPSLIGLCLLLNFFYWRYRDEEIRARSCFWGWVWFISSALVGEALAHLLYPSAYEGMGDNAAQIFGFLVALIASPFLSFVAWAVTRKLVKLKQKRIKLAERMRLKEMRKAANEMIKQTEKELSSESSDKKVS